MTATDMPTRRKFLSAALGAMAFPGMALANTSGVRALSPISRDGEHFAASFAFDGKSPRMTPLPMRGHGLLLHPVRRNEALIISRRPGTMMVRVDLNSGRQLRQWSVDEDRRVLGHAVYGAKGDVVFVTEDNIDSGSGIVSVRDAGTMRVLQEFDTHGIGPHELLLMPDGVTLAVANGGIRTLPETGRVKLNRGRIETSLVYLDVRSGRLLGKYVVPSTQQSLRHLALGKNGRLAAALQFEGDKTQPNVPLMMFHGGEAELQFAAAPEGVWDSMKQYAASIAYDAVSDRFALTCPFGDTLGVWSGAGEHVGCIDVPKVSGIAFHRGHGFASNELGELYQLDIAKLTADRLYQSPGLQWDNHLYLADA